MAENDFATNGNVGLLMAQSTRWSFGTEWRLGYNDMHGYETETFLPHVSGRLGRRKMRSSDGLCYESNWTKSGPYKLGLASKQYL